MWGGDARGKVVEDSGRVAIAVATNTAQFAEPERASPPPHRAHPRQGATSWRLIFLARGTRVVATVRASRGREAVKFAERAAGQEYERIQLEKGSLRPLQRDLW